MRLWLFTITSIRRGTPVKSEALSEEDQLPVRRTEMLNG